MIVFRTLAKTCQNWRSCWRSTEQSVRKSSCEVPRRAHSGPEPHLKAVADAGILGAKRRERAELHALEHFCSCNLLPAAAEALRGRGCLGSPASEGPRSPGRRRPAAERDIAGPRCFALEQNSTRRAAMARSLTKRELQMPSTSQRPLLCRTR